MVTAEGAAEVCLIPIVLRLQVETSVFESLFLRGEGQPALCIMHLAALRESASKRRVLVRQAPAAETQVQVGPLAYGLAAATAVLHPEFRLQVRQRVGALEGVERRRVRRSTEVLGPMVPSSSIG